ncbi:hypothetical protein ACF0H5_018885 [Mactra antiquata]
MSTKKDLFSYLAIYDENKDGESFIPLSMGAPGPEMLAGSSELLIKSTECLLKDPLEERYTFQYGPCRGDPGFCNEMAKFLSTEYGDSVSSEDIMVTAGATQGLHLVATVMFDKDTPIFIEDPTYFIGQKMLKDDLGMNVIAVPTDDDGINIECLEELLQKYKPDNKPNKSPFWSMIYTIPTFNNPKGHCMSPGRCEALVALSRKYDVLLFAEDVYNMLHYSGAKYCPRRLLSFDRRSDPDFKGNVLSNCTFSKILAPGLRIGWIEAPPRVLDPILNSKTSWSGGSFNHYTSKLMATALKEGLLQKHLELLRKEYGERMNIACNALTECLPDSVKCHNPNGGFFIWLKLPDQVDTLELLRMALTKYKVNFINGSSTSPSGSYQNYVRLSISFCDRKQIYNGVSKFCEAVKEVMEK